MAVGDRIKELRRQHNLTQDELAMRMGTTKQTIHKYENNIVTNIPSDKIEQLAKIFDVTPSYIMGWEEEPKVHTIAAHHDDYDFTEEELEEIEDFKKYVLSKRKK
ncbi:MAG: helix-turn-helix transcriptional regulator [Firmicutes bacterium]|jgi:transcriptional regulator with XRE-family HTH domain|nr:helix-turn-helix transcriptional regulator [Bacillota bacterium]